MSSGKEASGDGAVELVQVHVDPLQGGGIHGEVTKGGHISHALITVDGMTCSSCSGAIERHVGGLPGVASVNVSLVLENARVTYDAAATSAADIAEEIDDLGYPAAVAEEHVGIGGAGDAGLRQATFSVSGMTCATCVGTIERHFNGLEWVDKAAVNFATETLVCNYLVDHPEASITGILEELGDIGFEGEYVEPVKGISFADRAIKHQRYMLRQVVLCSLFSVPLFLLAMVLPFMDAVGWLMFRTVGMLTGHALVLWVLGTIVQFGFGWRFMKAAYAGLKHGTANMSVLITLGTMAAYTFASIGVFEAMLMTPVDSMEMVDGEMVMSERHMRVMDQLMDDAHFFETAATLITLVLVGKYLEALAKGNTSQALQKLLTLQPDTAMLLTPVPAVRASASVSSNDDGKSLIAEAELEDQQYTSREVPADSLRRGQLVKVVRGGKLPADGVVRSGAADVDESMVTGEPMAVHKTAGDSVVGATMLEEGTLVVEVTSSGQDTTVSQILKLMTQAQMSKAPVQLFADRLSSRFVPVVVFLSVFTFIVWISLVSSGALPTHWHEDEGDVLFALMFAIAVMVIACPCALGLATPTAVMVGTGVGAGMGILIKGGEALEKAHKVTAFVFDKTGTLTEGKPSVSSVKLIPNAQGADAHDLARVAFLIGSAELNSEHILGKAVIAYAEGVLAESKSGQPLVQPKEFEALSGHGLKCLVDGVRVHIGNRAWIHVCGLQGMSEVVETAMHGIESLGQTALLVALDGAVVAVLAIADKVKKDARLVLNGLKSRGIMVWMCTGDNRTTASVVAAELGISHVHAEVLPMDKFNLVKQLQAQGHVVGMVGDGINDSPALAQADLSVAIGTGTDVAVEAAQVVLVKDNLRDIYTALDLSQVTFSRIRYNFMWALGYNLLGIPVAMGMFYPLFQVRLPPTLAGAAMAMSSVSVVMSSLLIKWYKRPDLPLSAACVCEMCEIARKKVDWSGLQFAELEIQSEFTGNQDTESVKANAQRRGVSIMGLQETAASSLLCVGDGCGCGCGGDSQVCTCG
jgi:Cu+-exporting ATPase